MYDPWPCGLHSVLVFPNNSLLCRNGQSGLIVVLPVQSITGLSTETVSLLNSRIIISFLPSFTIILCCSARQRLKT